MKKKSELNSQQSLPQSDTQEFFVGDKVSLYWRGDKVEGIVVTVSDDGRQQIEFVYTVRLENGETRHFTAEELELA